MKEDNEIRTILENILNDGEKVVNVPCIAICDSSNIIEKICMPYIDGLSVLKDGILNKVEKNGCIVYSKNGVNLMGRTYRKIINRKVIEIPVLMSKENIIFPYEDIYKRYIGVKLYK